MRDPGPNSCNAISLDRKLVLFRACFSGLEHVYGTRDAQSGKVRQVKQPVTDTVLLDHIEGRQHYGVYLLVGDRTRASAVDFDTEDVWPVAEFVGLAEHYRLPVYVERSKSKGHHVWMFFRGDGVLAAKARRVARHMLEEIAHPHVEVFPKHVRVPEILTTSFPEIMATFGAVISGSVASQRRGAMGLPAARYKEDDQNVGSRTDSDAS